MSKFISAAALSAVFAGVVAFAGPAQAQVSQVSRAEVIAQLKEARASGELARLNSENGSFGAFEAGNGSSTVSRAAVIDDLKRARASGELDAAFRDSYADGFLVSPVNGSAKSTVTRADVVAELARAKRSGEFARINSNDSHDGGQ